MPPNVVGVPPAPPPLGGPGSGPHGDAVASTSSSSPQQTYPPWRIAWRNVLGFIYLHGAALYGLYLILSWQTKIMTIIFGALFGIAGGLGVTAGAHRLWAHRSYKARWPLRVFLMLLQTSAFQNHVYEWVRDHRVHHKFTDTNADPHNSSRGFFFSHMGWLMVKKHPDVKRKGRTVDLSDLEKDPVVRFQRMFYLLLLPLCCFALPTWVPVRFWGEDPIVAWHVSTMLRYVISLHIAWLVNSAAHIHGMQPFDRHSSPRDNKTVAHLAFGEGWHNYHHVFPWDYKAAELGRYSGNLTTALIDGFARIGWAYALKTVPKDVVERRVQRTGDGSHPSAARAATATPTWEPGADTTVWGWGDQDMPREDIIAVNVRNDAE